MKKRYVKLITLFSLFGLFGLTLEAQAAFKPKIPKGWTLVTVKNKGSIPDNARGIVLEAFDDPKCKVVAYDPVAADQGHIAMMGFNVEPINISDGSVQLTDSIRDKYFEDSFVELSQNFKKSPGHNLVDATKFAIGNQKIMRFILDGYLSLLVKNGPTYRTMVYMFLSGGSLMSVVFSAPLNDFPKYGDAFQSTFKNSFGN